MHIATTLQPLHFEDLEPKRFEDLVRQLIYEFRDWLVLEALGRAGSDAGVDILGIERLPIEPSPEAGEDSDTPAWEERQWIVQCKREKQVTPRRVVKYVRESLAGKQGVHGFILATCADLSAKARTAFRATVRDFAVEEAYIWGRSELEDLLFAPRNDHLLFAYFGVSLQVRRRSRRAQLVRDIALKRKLVSVVPLKSAGVRDILLRDPDASEYPFIHDWETFRKKPRWRYYRITGHFPPGHLQVILRETIGWYDKETGAWDIPDLTQFAPYNHRLYNMPREAWQAEKQAADAVLETIPEDRRQTIRVYGYVAYDRIMAVDDVGDAYNDGTHLVILYDPRHAFFEPDMFTITLPQQFASDVRLDEDKRIEFFSYSRSG